MFKFLDKVIGPLGLARGFLAATGAYALTEPGSAMLHGFGLPPSVMAPLLFLGAALRSQKGEGE